MAEQLEWKSQTIGQNKKIQEIAAAAEKASTLVTINTELAATALTTAGVFLTGLLSPYILLLRTTADAIDNFVSDFRDIGFYVLEVTDIEGGYLIPNDADGNPIKLIMNATVIPVKLATAVSANQGAQFAGWAKEFLGEEDILLTGPQKTEYEVEVGKKLPEDSRDANAFDNKMSEYDPFLGMYKMTPSQVIATIVSAMDDKLDQRRPNFSKDAEAGAVVVLVGISDLTKNLANLNSILTAFQLFFGGEAKIKKDAEGDVVNDEFGNPVEISPGGISNGFAKIFGIAKGLALQLDNPTQNDVELKVSNVCIARGTEEDKIKLNRGGISYMKEGQFELNDFVVGPRVKFGARCMGYVSNIKSTEDGDSISGGGINEGGKYKTQVLTITGLTQYDRRGWKSLSSGAKLQQVAFVNKYKTHTDQNTGDVVSEGPFNDFEYIPNLPVTREYTILNDQKEKEDKTDTYTPDKAKTKVERKSGKTLLTEVGGGQDVVEKHTLGAGPGNSESGGTLETNNMTIGDIFTPIVPDAPHPNFKAVKMDDLIGDFKTFFSAIDALTQALRDMADGAEKALQDMIDYLEAKIEELRQIAEALQKILALFTTGLGDAGVYVLNIPVAIGGNDYIKSSLQSAGNRPPDTLDFTLAFMMMGGGVGGTEEGFKTLQKLLVP